MTREKEKRKNVHGGSKSRAVEFRLRGSDQAQQKKTASLREVASGRDSKLGLPSGRRKLPKPQSVSAVFSPVHTTPSHTKTPTSSNESRLLAKRLDSHLKQSSRWEEVKYFLSFQELGACRMTSRNIRQGIAHFTQRATRKSSLTVSV